MNAKQFDEQCKKDERDQNKVVEEYRTLGYVTSKEDEQALHMSFSPVRVPRKLTKLQVRRRINKYRKVGNTKSIKEVMGHYLTIRINGQLFVSANFTGKVPATHGQLKNLLRNII